MSASTVHRPTATGHCKHHNPARTFHDLLRRHAIAERNGDQHGAQLFAGRVRRVYTLLELADENGDES